MKKKEERRGQRMILISRSPFPWKLERTKEREREREVSSSLKNNNNNNNKRGLYLGRQIPTFRVLVAHLLRRFLIIVLLLLYIYIYIVSLTTPLCCDLFLTAAKVSVPFKTTSPVSL